MIQAKDLMIGDWVSQCELNVPVKVQSIMRHYGDENVYFYHDAREYISNVSKLNPIPLTEEILEKNGFGFIDTSNDEYSSVWTGWWILDGLELGCCDNSKFPVFFNISDTNVKVNYVHELQHALRLCGIEKEIEMKHI